MSSNNNGTALSLSSAFPTTASSKLRLAATPSTSFEPKVSREEVAQMNARMTKLEAELEAANLAYQKKFDAIIAALEQRNEQRQQRLTATQALAAIKATIKSDE